MDLGTYERLMLLTQFFLNSDGMKINTKWLSKYRHLINITFGTLLDQPKTHYMEELAIQQKENGPCDMFETSKCESKQILQTVSFFR